MEKWLDSWAVPAALAAWVGAGGCQSRSGGAGGVRSCLLVSWEEAPRSKLWKVLGRVGGATGRKEATVRSGLSGARQAGGWEAGRAAGRTQPPSQAHALPPVPPLPH